MRVHRALSLVGTISACLALAGTAQAAPQDGPLPVGASGVLGQVTPFGQYAQQMPGQVTPFGQYAPYTVQ